MIKFLKKNKIALLIWAVIILIVQFVVGKQFNVFILMLGLVVCAIMERIKEKLLKKHYEKEDHNLNEQ